MQPKGYLCSMGGGVLQFEWFDEEWWDACCKVWYHHSPQRTQKRTSGKLCKLSVKKNGARGKGQQNSPSPNGCCQWGQVPMAKKVGHIH